MPRSSGWHALHRTWQTVTGTRDRSEDGRHDGFVDDNQLRSVLEAELRAARARHSELSRELDEVVAAAAGSNLDDEHDPEGATIAFEREQLAMFRDGVQRRLDDLATALRRLDNGSYGICTVCGGRIADERLAALPTALACVACAARRR